MGIDDILDSANVLSVQEHPILVGGGTDGASAYGPKMYYNCMQESELSEVIPYPSPSTRYYSYFTPFACHGSEVGIVSRTW